MTKIHVIHNVAKLKILLAVRHCQNEDKIATSTEIARLTGMKKNTVCNRLHHLSEDWPYLIKTWARPPKRHPTARTRNDKKNRRKKKKPLLLKTRDFHKYTLAEEGMRVLPKLLERYNNGLELNLRHKKPRQVINGKIIEMN